MKQLLSFAICVSAGLAWPVQAEVSLEQIELPDGFQISVYAEGVENARQMALGDKGTLFVGSRREGDVYAISDHDGDQRADQVRKVASGLTLPTGLEFRDGSLYVAALDRILRYDEIETRLDFPPPPVVVTDDLPDKSHHGWKYLRFGPDGMLYFNVGAPCNVCDEPGFAEIRRIEPDGSGMQTYARGIRNSVGLAFHPQTGELWFTDNGRDHMGDELPACELNHAPKAGLHFGFPYCHQGDTLDPEFGKGHDCADYTPPAINLGPHVAPLGLAFYTGGMFPAEYCNQLFIAEHGSWNRSSKIGYRVKLVRFDEAGQVLGQSVFASGWLQGQNNWGRPNDVLVMPDGALLISDDQADVIYRISYQPAE
ncbi:MAG TPA: sorbosone dehydrogenase family protein [Xanthomonadales bacterium]|nr:sorbosone dehydrogenase family protein [Xanthomonadales bacterium]